MVLSSIIIFLVVLSVLVFVHEWGHYITARLTGMRVDEFAIGFPPKIWGWRRGETDFNLNLIPIGGYVKIYGENFEEDDTANPADRGRAFSARPRWAQALVLVAGVGMNVVLAWAILFGLLLAGAPTAVEEGNATEAAKLTVTNIVPEAPADGMLPLNAEIVSVTAGERTLPSLTPSALKDFVTTAGTNNETLSVRYTAGNEEKTVEITPRQGLSESDPEQHLIGVQTVLVEVVRQPFFTAVGMATSQTIAMTKAIAIGLFEFFTDLPRGEADLSQVSGPVGIVGYVGDAAKSGLVAILMFTAVISLNLAVINLLPIPALDGGRLLFVAIETVLRRDLNPVWLGRINAIGFIFLLGLLIVVTFNDVLKLL